MDPLTFATVGLFGLIGFNIAAAWVTGRTARSKGYKFAAFFVLSLVSWFITAVVAVFIKPKGNKMAKTRLNSVVMLAIGTVVEFTGLGMLPEVSEKLSDEQLLAVFASQESMGAIAIALAGALIVVGGVANDYRNTVA